MTKEEKFTYPQSFYEWAWYMDAYDIFELANESKKLESMCENFTNQILKDTVFAKGNEVYSNLYKGRFDKYMFIKLFYDRKKTNEEILNHFQDYCQQQDQDWFDERYYECHCEGIKIVHGDCHCNHSDDSSKLRAGPYGIEEGKMPEMKINRLILGGWKIW